MFLPTLENNSRRPFFGAASRGAARLGAAILATVTLGAGGAARGEDQAIDVFNQGFLPHAVSVELGEKVTWVWQTGTHTIASGLPDGLPGTPQEPGAVFDAPLDAEHASFSHTFIEIYSEGLFFFCRQHPSHVGSVSISSGEIAERVGVVDNLFLPDEVFIFEGDSVRWEHEVNEGFHTVTSGRSSQPEDDPGALFDAESSNERPSFTYRFDQAGDVYYFCIPHELMGMTGVVRVQKKFLRGDADPNGALELTDAYSILEFLFLSQEARACPDAMDSNDDGKVDLGDSLYLIFYLFAGGPLPPKPRILPGADRTEDGLYCLP